MGKDRGWGNFTKHAVLRFLLVVNQMLSVYMLYKQSDVHEVQSSAAVKRQLEAYPVSPA